MAGAPVGRRNLTIDFGVEQSESDPMLTHACCRESSCSVALPLLDVVGDDLAAGRHKLHGASQS